MSTSTPTLMAGSPNATTLYNPAPSVMHSHFMPAMLTPYIIRVRGLPYNVPDNDLVLFFHDVHICKRGIHMVLDFEEPTGEAYIELLTNDDVLKALQHNGQTIGHRYLEIFRSSREQMEDAGVLSPRVFASYNISPLSVAL
uniref:Heterogeneous nuclear ribonucleoprotein H n=1 Tax=Lygus hesperus TaxID=30085 RepID=A0A0A9XSM9_LYGHE